MQIKRRLPHDPQGHSSALNDILFILLLFFLIISTLANPNVVKLSIPKAKSDTKAKQTVVVSINDKPFATDIQKVGFEEEKDKGITYVKARYDSVFNKWPIFKLSGFIDAFSDFEKKVLVLTRSISEQTFWNASA